MKPLNNTVRRWLIENNYDDIATLIDQVMLVWERKGVRTRRNWWEVLAGDREGNQRTIEGITLPVLRAARIHQRMRVTDNCLCRNPNEIIPPARKTGRWPIQVAHERRFRRTKKSISLP